MQQRNEIYVMRFDIDRGRTQQVLVRQRIFFVFFSESVPLELCYALDESEEGSIAVNLLPLLLAARNSATNKNKTDR